MSIRYFTGCVLSMARYFGISKAFLFVWDHALLKLAGIRMAERLSHVRIPGCRYSVLLDLNSSDFHVFYQIYVLKEYDVLKDIRDAGLIIDCGGNVGLSAIWFLNRFADAHVVVIEPDRRNYDLCQRNLEPYGRRVTLKCAAVWPYPAGLIISKAGHYWARQVREPLDGEKPDTHAVVIDALLKESGFAAIDLLKIDIEGSEKPLFAHPCDPWLRQTKNVVIELHDGEACGLFEKALSAYRYSPSFSGNLTVCRNISPKG
ncbi:MAG: FkbM family methyltransferase [Candidatus Omnitrophica bacterium]|nr:FkbM family methyltransferase [Candidatus Omnitrophota bacterium]MDD5672091.1 FkbM family methyltransferase [Candidatus Omnitrophota bacterium]